MTHRYQCLRCRGTWEGPAGPQLCPFCNNLYLTWITYPGRTEGTSLKDVGLTSADPSPRKGGCNG